MPISVPPAVNYQSPLVAVPTRWNQPPVEGTKMIVCEIDWGQMGGANNSVNVNLQNNATLNFSQIVALVIDNSLCAADVQFIFPDTEVTVSVPSYAPYVVIPVFTNMTQFYVWSPDALAIDITRFSIHNSLPPPVTTPFTVEQQTAVAGNLTADGSTTYTLLPNTVSGTVEGIYVTRNSPVINQGSQRFSIVDGTGRVLGIGQFDSQANGTWNTVLLNLQPVHLRFSQGLTLQQTGVNVGGAYCVNILYREP